MSHNRIELINTYFSGVITILMTLKTEWVSNLKIRNDLSYLDIAAITFMISYNMTLVFYALYLDTTVIYRYFLNRIKKVCCFRYYIRFMQMMNSLDSILNFNNY